MQAQETHPLQDSTELTFGRILQTTQRNWSDDSSMSNLVDFAHHKSVGKLRQTNTFNVSDLKNRGWTKSMIPQYLGADDAIAAAGMNAGRPRQLYLKTQIFAIEARPEFKERREAAAPKRLASNALFIEKAERLACLAHSLKFQVPDIPLLQLRALAIEKFRISTLPSEQLRNEALFLIDPIESACSDMEAFNWNYGVREARQVLRRRILTTAMNAYPHLSNAILRICRTEEG
jgi:hypothetical protein